MFFTDTGCEALLLDGENLKLFLIDVETMVRSTLPSGIEAETWNAV